MVECGRYAHLDTSNDRPDRCDQTSIRTFSRTSPSLPSDRAGKRNPRVPCVEHPLSIGQGRRSDRQAHGVASGNHGSCWIDRASASGAPTGNGRIRRSIGSRILAASTKVIAVSESVAAHVIELGASPEKVVVVPNGVDTNRFRPTDERKSNQIAFVGRLVSNKGSEDALEAFAKLGRSDWQLVFVGDGPMRRRLELKASELGVGGSVQFLGARR